MAPSAHIGKLRGSTAFENDLSLPHMCFSEARVRPAEFLHITALSLPKTQLADHQRSEPRSMPVTSWIKLRAASVLPQKTKLRIANEHTARSAFSSERLEVFFDQAAWRG